MSNYWKNVAGFNVYTQNDPDFLTWLLEQWKEHYKEDSGQTFSKLPIVEEFIKFGRELISQKPIVAMEYIDSGLAVILSTGEKIPFNKSSTLTVPSVAVNVMGDSNTVAQPVSARQVDTSFSITGEGR